MPFGLKNVEANYKRYIDVVLFKQIGQNLYVYFDGFMVKNPSEGKQSMT